MGVYSEMDMEQFENDEMGPFQMDSHRPDAVEWHEQAGSRQQLPRPPQFLPAVRWRNLWRRCGHWPPKQQQRGCRQGRLGGGQTEGHEEAKPNAKQSGMHSRPAKKRQNRRNSSRLPP